MRQLIAIIALMALALPAAAAAGCSTGTVEWDGTSPWIVKDDPTVNPSPSVVGQYLWVTPPETVTVAFNGQIVAQAPAGETSSVNIPSDAETFTVCYGTADAPAPSELGSIPAIGGEEVEREPTSGQQILDIDAETYLRLIPFGIHLN